MEPQLFGIGWDGWAGKDLSGIMDFCAIEFYVRTQEGRSFGLPIVLTLEDYSGGMGFAYTGNKYFERVAIDTVWQKVEVPLADFDLETENLDVTNIKQLQLELQQSGSIYIDDIRLVFHEPQEVEPWLVEEELPDPLGTPITIFDDMFINGNGWGMMDFNCQKVSLTREEAYSGDRAIHAKWDATGDCGLYRAGFGATWNKWHPVDFGGNMENYAFEFYIFNKGESRDKLPIFIAMEDYDRVITQVQVSSEYSEKDLFDATWVRVTVPVSDFPTNFDFTRVKTMGFEMEGKGEVLIDQIKLIQREVN
jgi:hypothetical protein